MIPQSICGSHFCPRSDLVSESDPELPHHSLQDLFWFLTFKPHIMIMTALGNLRGSRQLHSSQNTNCCFQDQTLAAPSPLNHRLWTRLLTDENGRGKWRKKKSLCCKFVNLRIYSGPTPATAGQGERDRKLRLFWLTFSFFSLDFFFNLLITIKAE